jgi:formyltetrahydrofolate-dependent phosphoribosylglycinamide formyltransferase
VSRPLRGAVFASGGGTNLQALLDHRVDEWNVSLVLSNRADAGALARARRAGVAQAVIETGSEARAVDEQMLAALEAHDVDFVLLAGYLRLVPGAVVQRYKDRMVNIHPALLPSFGGKGMYGLHVHRAVIESGVRITGPTVHLVDEVYDRGRILAQWPVPVRADDTPESLAGRVLEVEHKLYPRVVDHLVARWSRGRASEPLKESGTRFELA